MFKDLYTLRGRRIVVKNNSNKEMSSLIRDCPYDHRSHNADEEEWDDLSTFCNCSCCIDVPILSHSSRVLSNIPYRRMDCFQQKGSLTYVACFACSVRFILHHNIINLCTEIEPCKPPKRAKVKSHDRELNPGPLHYKCSALSLSYHGIFPPRIEREFADSKSAVLPLHHRKDAQNWDRTSDLAINSRTL